jgi:capsular polysaccharide export protein
MWKRRTVEKFLSSSEGAPRFCRNSASAVREAVRQKGRVVVWASREPADLASACADAGVPLLRLEDGFLRSVGLGADFFPAASLALDAGGMYYDPSSLSDLEHLIEQGCFDATVLDRARRLRATIVQQGVTKYNVGGRADISWPTGQRRLLVPGQVEDDRSIQCGSPLVSTNLDLLTRVRAENPDAFIVYKPHPDIAAGHRRGAIPDHLAQQQANLVVQDVSSAALMENIDEVHTMTSLIGFEALMRGRLVATYGSPFYAGWGLTRDLLSTPRRTREASLDELVAAALILYPLYVDPLTGLPCTPEVVVERLAGGQSGLSRPTTLTRLRRLMGSLRVISGRLAGI